MARTTAPQTVSKIIDQKAVKDILETCERLDVQLRKFPQDMYPTIAQIELAASHKQDLTYSDKTGLSHESIYAKDRSGKNGSTGKNRMGPFNPLDLVIQMTWMLTVHYMNLKSGTPGHVIDVERTRIDDGLIVLQNGQKFRVSVTEVTETPKPATQAALAPSTKVTEVKAK